MAWLGAMSAAAPAHPPPVTLRADGVARGERVLLKTFGYYLPTCESGGLPTVDVLTPPAHGEVTFAPHRFSVDASSNSLCLGKEILGTGVYYKSSSSDESVDHLSLRISFPDKHMALVNFDVTTR